MRTIRAGISVSAVAILGIVAPACLPAQTSAEASVWPTDGWAVASPSEEGLNEAPLVELHEKVEAGGFGYVDRLLVVRNGLVVFSERYDNDYRKISEGRAAAAHQYNYEHPDWHPYFMGRDVHTLQSVTKSITSALIGIAIERDEIDGTAVLVLDFFPDELGGADERLKRATLEDLLTMRLGMEWHETDRPIGPTNTTIQLEESEDWFRFTFDQPMQSEPGEVWVYNSGASHLMSGIVKEATGKYVDEYAEEHLFRPLGIREYHWKKTPTGHPDTEGGLYLKAEDLAKIGYLYLNDGIWDGRRILPDGWVASSVTRHVVDTAPSNPNWNPGYGYQWWRPDREGVEIWAGFGYGGQFLLVLPEYDIVGAVNSWNIFGRQPSILGPFIDALLESAGRSPQP